MRILLKLKCIYWIVSKSCKLWHVFLILFKLAWYRDYEASFFLILCISKATFAWSVTKQTSRMKLLGLSLSMCLSLSFDEAELTLETPELSFYGGGLGLGVRPFSTFMPNFYVHLFLHSVWWSVTRCCLWCRGIFSPPPYPPNSHP